MSLCLMNWDGYVLRKNVYFAHAQCDSLARKPNYSSVTSYFFVWSLWKLTRTKHTSIEAEPSYPSTKWTVSVTSRRDRQTSVWLSVECLCVPLICTQLNSVFVVREYWETGSFKQYQRTFRNKYGEETVPTKSCIHKLVKKLETTGSVSTRHAGDQKMCDRTVQNVNHTKVKRLLRNVWVS
jgi:hypothetical protein